MLLTTDFIDPAELTGYVRAALADHEANQDFLAQFIPNRVIDDLDYRFLRGGQGLTEAATFRSYDTESPVGSRPGVSRVSGELPPISRKLRLSEYDRLRQRKVVDSQIRDAILNDAERLTRQIAARIALARGDALFNGQVSINENGVVATVDFGRDASMEVTAATLWSASGNVFGDLETWIQAYVDRNGVEPGAILMRKGTLSTIRTNSTVRGNIFAAGAPEPTIVTRDRVNEFLSAAGLPPIVLNDAKVLVGGVATALVPATKIALLPAPVGPDGWQDTDLGATLWGTTAESLEPDYALAAGEEPGIVAGSYSTKDPVALWTKSAAISLPVLANPDLVMVATVKS